MIGCAFSIDKDFFFEIGSYDEGMNIWGSENMEMSLRVWQCGGSMQILPCSHVAHLYRISTYSFDGNAEAIKVGNGIRLIDVWMPEFRDILYAVSPRNRNHSGGNITERMALKQRLKCKDFRWYLEHVYPESCLNNEFIHFGEIKSSAKQRCLDICGGNIGDPVKLVACHNQGGNQVLGLTKAQKIVTPEDRCIGIDKKSVVSVTCIQAPRWNYDNEVSNPATGNIYLQSCQLIDLVFLDKLASARR
ncbi:hypothetical protein HA402_012557 [Bradysia odoriphaga]|nr:hypothetical protein HA402_012557 [Bradysia odoriphaga]